MTIPRTRIRKADWNYKFDGTREDIERLARSIQRDRSAGVIAVREVPAPEGLEDDGEKWFEAIDGNHRLDAIDIVGWEVVTSENFGPIPLSEAVLISKRRNAQWFVDDNVQLSRLMKHEVLPEVSLDEMVEFMPETKRELEGLIALADTFVFEDNETEVVGEEKDPRDWFVTTKMSLPKEAFDVFMNAYKLIEETLRSNHLRLHPKKDIAMGQVVEALAAEYLSGGEGFGKLISMEQQPDGDDDDRELN